MPAPSSYDLRQKALDAVQRGEKKLAVCRFLNISRNTLDLWLKRNKQTGTVRPSKKLSGGKPSQIQNWHQFYQFVLQHSDKTQQQIAELWGNHLTQPNVSYACRKLGITRKKTYGYEKRNESETAELFEKLKNLDQNQIVYVDEAGFDNQQDYPVGYRPKGERCYGMKSGTRKERVSWIAALRDKTIFAPLTFQGSCNRYLFKT